MFLWCLSIICTPSNILATPSIFFQCADLCQHCPKVWHNFPVNNDATNYFQWYIKKISIITVNQHRDPFPNTDCKGLLGNGKRLNKKCAQSCRYSILLKSFRPHFHIHFHHDHLFPLEYYMKLSLINSSAVKTIIHAFLITKFDDFNLLLTHHLHYFRVIQNIAVNVQ